MENSGNSPKLFWRKLVRVQEFWKIQIILNKKKFINIQVICCLVGKEINYNEPKRYSNYSRKLGILLFS
jgi:hypothetical protein